MHSAPALRAFHDHKTPCRAAPEPAAGCAGPENIDRHDNDIPAGYNRRRRDGGRKREAEPLRLPNKAEAVSSDDNYDTLGFWERLSKDRHDPDVLRNDNRPGGSAIDGQTRQHGVARSAYAYASVWKNRSAEIGPVRQLMVRELARQPLKLATTYSADSQTRIDAIRCKRIPAQKTRCGSADQRRGYGPQDQAAVPEMFEFILVSGSLL